MNKNFTDIGWDDYIYWRNQNLKIFDRINALLKDIERNGVNKGIGKPEKLKHEDGWSRRIDDKNRLIYKIDTHGYLNIISCKDHYK